MAFVSVLMDTYRTTTTRTMLFVRHAHQHARLALTGILHTVHHVGQMQVYQQTTPVNVIVASLAPQLLIQPV